VHSFLQQTKTVVDYAAVLESFGKNREGITICKEGEIAIECATAMLNTLEAIRKKYDE